MYGGGHDNGGCHIDTGAGIGSGGDSGWEGMVSRVLRTALSRQSLALVLTTKNEQEKYTKKTK